MLIFRWEIGAKDELAGYMQVLYETLLTLYDEIGRLLFKQGKSYCLYYAKEGVNDAIYSKLYSHNKFMFIHK